MAVSSVSPNSNDTGNNTTKPPVDAAFKSYAKKFSDFNTTNAEIDKMMEEAMLGDKASAQSAQYVQMLHQKRSERIALRSNTDKDDHDVHMLVINNAKTAS